MRIYLKLTRNTELVPFAHQHLLTGILHKWFGQNDFHDDISLYSFSQLQNGKLARHKKDTYLDFPDGSEWFISSWNDKLIQMLIRGIQQNPEFIYGMRVEEVIIREIPDLSQKTEFYLASPVFIKRDVNDLSKFYYYTDQESADFMKETLKHKMAIAGLDEDETLNISFHENYNKASIRNIVYKGINNKCSWCPVIIKAKPETKAFAWEVGVGNSTGIGFGALK